MCIRDRRTHGDVEHGVAALVKDLAEEQHHKHRVAVEQRGDCPEPVSYTHLDVYKRQVHTRKITDGQRQQHREQGRHARERGRHLKAARKDLRLSLIHIFLYL